MFKNLTIPDAVIWSVISAAVCLIAGIIFRIWFNHFCHIYEKETDSVTRRKGSVLKTITLLLFAASGLFIGSLISIVIAYNTALSHGMEDNGFMNSGFTYGEIQSYNKNSVSETKLSVDALKGKAVIFIRYDCPDCVMLHDQLADLKDMTFVSSRSKLGKTARDLYDINLTEVPQGVYIDGNGNVTTISIIQHSGDTITIDLQQIAILREMADRRKSLSDE